MAGSMMRVESCVLYARLSLSKEESVSIERQLLSCRKYAEARNWTVLGEFVDDGVSATSNRPEARKGWRQLLGCSGFDAVIIWKVDRLARRVLDFLVVDQVLQDRGAGLVAVEDPIDMTSPQGRAFAVMLSVFAELEAASISARVSAARKHIIGQGRWPGGGVPYGYKTIPMPNAQPGKQLVKDPERINWLEQMVTLATTQDTTVNGIAEWLTRHDVPAPDRSRPKAGVGWNRQTVDGILRNPVLAGMTPYNPGRARSAKGRGDGVLCDEAGNPIIREDLAIISVEQHHRLVATLDNRAAPQAAKLADRQHTNIFLSRLARCADCGVYLYRGTNQKRPVLYCPKCRQTIGRTALDAYLIGRLLDERGEVADDSGQTVSQHWRTLGVDDHQSKRQILISQLGSLRIRRGVVGRYFDEERVLLEWADWPDDEIVEVVA